MKVVTVLKSGGDFLPLHVQALQRQVLAHTPLAHFICLTDLAIAGVECWPLTCSWPGWWSKFEMFAPDVKGDFLFMDLDTVVLGPLDDMFTGKLTILRDFYRDGTRRAEGLQSSLMYLCEDDRVQPGADFRKNPAAFMEQYARGGDQAVLERYWMKTAARWQDELPGQIVSYKVHCQKGVPADARVVIFHGKPRPWHSPEFKDLY